MPKSKFLSIFNDGKFRRRIRREYTWSGSAWVQTNEVHYIHDGNLPIQERDANNLPLVAYTRGPDLSGSIQGAGGIGGLLARTDLHLLVIRDPGASAYYHADGNGNITALINTNQALVAKYLYDPYGNILSQSGPLADANVYRFSSKEFHVHSGLTYDIYRFYDSNLQRWPNRDPLGEPGFETLHLVTQPLFIRKLRLNINDSEIQYFLAMALQSGSINMVAYLSNAHATYTGSSISGLEFLNFLQSGQAAYAPNWPVELLENPNLFDFVGNDPLDGIDPFGTHWWNTVGDWLEGIWIGIEHTLSGETGAGAGALKCGPGMYNIYTNEPPKYRFINDPDNPTNPVPPTAG